MKKNIKTLAALLIASATFVACSSDNDIIGENQQPVNPTGKYTMTINASKGDGATTRALGLSGSTLNATWTDGEEVAVYEGDTPLGTLSATNSNGATCTLTGELTTAPTGSEVTLKFNTPTYTGQDGTLDYIASNCDYATATTTVTVSGNKITGTDVEFTNQQAIVKFTLIDKADGTTSLNAKPLVVSVGSTDYTINPASGTSEIYVAIPGISGQTVTLTATVGDDTYTYEKSGVTFTNGQYYEITVKMTKQVPATGHALSASAVGEIVGTDGNVYAVADKDNLPEGVTAVAMVAYKSATTGKSLAIALADEGTMNWNSARSRCGGKTAIGGKSWKLPTMDEWKQMFSANGGNEGSYTGLNTALSAAGGASSTLNGQYWSSSEGGEWDEGYEEAWDVDLYGSTVWFTHGKNNNRNVRACLAF